MLDWQALYQHSHLPISTAKRLWNWKPSSNLSSRPRGLLLTLDVDLVLSRHTVSEAQSLYYQPPQRMKLRGGQHSANVTSTQGSGGFRKASGQCSMASCTVPLPSWLPVMFLWATQCSELDSMLLCLCSYFPSLRIYYANFPRPWTTAASRIPASYKSLWLSLYSHPFAATREIRMHFLDSDNHYIQYASLIFFWRLWKFEKKNTLFIRVSHTLLNPDWLLNEYSL